MTKSKYLVIELLLHVLTSFPGPHLVFVACSMN